MLNSVLHHVGLSWIISSNNQMKYDIEETNYNWLDKGPWYNIPICYNFHGSVFEYLLEILKHIDTIVCVI